MKFGSFLLSVIGLQQATATPWYDLPLNYSWNNMLLLRQLFTTALFINLPITAPVVLL